MPLLPLLHFENQITNLETDSMDLIMCLNYIPAFPPYISLTSPYNVGASQGQDADSPCETSLL